MNIRKLSIVLLLILALCMTLVLCACNGEHTHTPGEWIIDAEATCAEAGSKHNVCTDCGEVLKTESVPVVNHDFQDGACTGCGSEDLDSPKPDDGKNPSEDNFGDDNPNGDNSDGVTPGDGDCEHELVKHEARSPSCTEIGWDEYVACSKCGHTTYNELALTEHDYVDGVCSNCGKTSYSQQLRYTTNSDGETCYVSGIGTCTDMDNQ